MKANLHVLDSIEVDRGDSRYHLITFSDDALVLVARVVPVHTIIHEHPDMTDTPSI